MRLIRKTSICCIVILAGITTFAAPGIASARQRPRPKGLGLTVENGHSEVELVKVGSPTAVAFAGFEAGEADCLGVALGKLRSNSRPTDTIALSGYQLESCSEGTRIVSGSPEEIELTSSGKIIEETSWTVELPGHCEYAVNTFEGTFAIPSVLILGYGDLTGTARLRPKKSAKTCAQTVTLLTGFDPEGSPYMAQLVEAN